MQQQFLDQHEASLTASSRQTPQGVCTDRGPELRARWGKARRSEPGSSGRPSVLTPARSGGRCRPQAATTQGVTPSSLRGLLGRGTEASPCQAQGTPPTRCLMQGRPAVSRLGHPAGHVAVGLWRAHTRASRPGRCQNPREDVGLGHSQETFTRCDQRRLRNHSEPSLPAVSPLRPQVR